MSRRRDEERQKQKILNFAKSYGMMSKEGFKKLNFQNTVKTTSVLTKEFSERLHRCSKMSFESQFILRLQKWKRQYGIHYPANFVRDLKFKKVQHWHRKDLKRKLYQAKQKIKYPEPEYEIEILGHTPFEAITRIVEVSKHD